MVPLFVPFWFHFWPKTGSKNGYQNWFHFWNQFFPQVVKNVLAPKSGSIFGTKFGSIFGTSVRDTFRFVAESPVWLEVLSFHNRRLAFIRIWSSFRGDIVGQIVYLKFQFSRNEVIHFFHPRHFLNLQRWRSTFSLCGPMPHWEQYLLITKCGGKAIPFLLFSMTHKATLHS